MDEFFRFVSRSERERVRLILEARAIYDSVFPPTDPVRERRGKAPATHGVGGAGTSRGPAAPFGTRQATAPYGMGAAALWNGEVPIVEPKPDGDFAL